ncbi:DDB1- and CUL4-associated factor 1 isoform X2 [Thrips palmi]|uniref:DDB1- and CUL4-associated factor 1 n=1 Tax=Thrips palmi TaxID=161013 RepID=A0A6P9AHW7_THRPL|nr:DDB1- and CUL4-associated factor 1 isoform X2 [Thrips palmi]
MENLSTETDIGAIFRLWEEGHNDPHHDPIPILTRLAELFEQETENYLKMDPDPFDERHPSRADPDCSLGHMLKVIFRKDAFMNKLVNDYLRDNYYARLGISGRNVRELNIAACRLMLDITPGLETSAVFETPSNDALVNRLFGWAKEAPEPLQTYATGLLAAAMEVQDIAVVFREKNSQLVPLMLKRLHVIQAQAQEERLAAMNSSRPFAHLGSKSEGKSDSVGTPTVKKRKTDISPHSTSKDNGLMSPPHWNSGPTTLSSNGDKVERRPSKDGDSASQRKDEGDSKSTAKVNVTLSEEDLPDGVGLLPPSTPGRETRGPIMSPPHSIPQHSVLRSPFHTSSNISECSNSSWAEMENYVIGSIQMYPLNIATQQMFILRYLTPMGEYQEFLSHVFEQNALELILKYTNLRESKDARLAFEALKYLASLLCHKKFSIEFINVHGLQRLLEVPRPSIAATGVSICLYYLAYCEDAIERVCLLPQHIISDLVTYALWLLECSHDSGRCHATMFFGLSFQFRVILEEFDSQDGLRKLYNVVSTLPIMSTEEEAALNEDEECSARQIVRHVCVALKRYFEAHLYIRAEQLRRAHMRESDDHRQLQHMPSYKATKSTPEEIQEQVETLLELMSFRANWPPVDELLRLGGVTLLLQVIAFAYEWNYSGRSVRDAETVRSALDVLSICSVMPQVQLLFCEQVSMPDEGLTVGMNIILGAAEGEIVADPDVQRSALSVLINCVCAPVHRIGGTIARFSGSGYARKKANFRLSEDVILKMWDSVRSNNGIMVFITLMTVKTPITDADSIRALACRALAGLARSETVKQIIGKLPLFISGQLQSLMQNPILQDKRQEHVSFQKYALELLERVSGRAKPSGNEFEISLANIHRANVIAQTRIHFNEKQLFQLIHQHLVAKGMNESAATLLKEAGLPSPKPALPPSVPLPFSYQRNAGPAAIRPRSSASPLTNHLHRLPLSSPHLSSPVSSTGTPTASGSSSSQSLAVAAASPAVAASSDASASLTPVPIKLSLSSHRRESLYMNSPASKSLQKQITYEATPGAASPLLKSSAVTAASSLIPTVENQVTLDSIITEYLTNQHALCKNPMITCPQFNLFEPHKCPDPKAKRSAPINFAMRNIRRSVFPPFGGPDGFRLDRRLVHSRFCPVRTFRPAEEDSFYTCCAFLPNGQQLVVGTYQGEVKLYNLQSTVQEEITVQCHESYINNLQPHKSGKLLLSSCTWRPPLSALWSINNTTFESRYTLGDEEYVEFSKQDQDKLIATNAQIATIYDLETGKKLMTLKPQVSNQYPKNRATFSPTNELVLSDGVLWDVNSGKEIHKLDKLNQSISGVFHPNGLEIVANTEVWDLRTFHLLRTVPLLDHCELVFSPDGAAIYTLSMEQENDDSKEAFESSFRTLDAYDYSPIATIDVKKNIHCIACNKFDTQIAIVENVGMFDNIQESSVRVYDVGRRRDDDDEAEEEEEDEEDDEMDSGDDGSSDDNLNANGLMNLIDDLDVDDEQNENDGDDAGDDQGDVEDEDSSSDDSNDIEELSIGSSEDDLLELF